MMKGNSSYVSNLGHNDPLEIIQLFSEMRYNSN